MTQRWMLTRRQFLEGSLVLASAAASVPAFVQRSAWAAQNTLTGQTASLPGASQDRILVVVELAGGNDGLNTVIPYGDPTYYKARPTIAVAQKEILTLDANLGIGLNPAMTDFKTLVDENIASIVQGVGYPNPNRSHFSSMDIWHTADPTGRKGTGWVGKTLDQQRAMQNGHIASDACICIGEQASPATIGNKVQPIAFDNANLFRWSGSDISPALAKAYAQFNSQLPSASAQADPTNQRAFLMRTAMDAQIASDKVRDAVGKAPITHFPNSSLSRQLQMVAAMIRAELPTRIYYVGMSGFDTHSNQTFAQSRGLRDFSGAMLAFYHELKAIGQQDRVVTMAFSEFGRRVQQNASNGTDHGTAAPLYLFGSALRPGLLGTHPSLTNLDHGDLIYNVDFRSVYAALLENWMKLDSQQVLGRKFMTPNIFRGV